MRHYFVFVILGDIPKSGKMFLEENLQDNKLATNIETSIQNKHPKYIILFSVLTNFKQDFTYEAQTLI